MRTTTATNRREVNVKDYEVLDDEDQDLIAEAWGGISEKEKNMIREEAEAIRS